MQNPNPFEKYPISAEPEERFAAPPPSKLTVLRLFVQESLQVVLPALILALTVHLFLAQATIVYGQSMEPSLFEKQRLIIDKVSYHFFPPKRDDIVVIAMPDMQEMLVKRVIGLPGETVEVREGVVYVNGQALSEPFLRDMGHESDAPIVLGPLNYFVMGDNRDNSNDSRSFGPVQRDYILGRVWLRYWPLNQFNIF
jgi:signal peptidase I